jgi:3'(2'), 5'-bisphosphate nucleotidase
MIEKIALSDIVRIAEKAGEKVLEIYHSKDINWEVEAKADDSPLTIADREANKIICDELEKLYPEIPIISEENKEVPYETRKDYQLFWLVDPLDGTKEFIKRNGEFTINIALVEGNRSVLGVVYAPVLGTCYFAKKNEGSFKTENGKTAQIHCAKFSKEDENLKVVASRSHINQETKDFIAQFKNPETVSMGSSLKFLLVAEGKAHLYPRLGPTMEWDTGAAQIVVEEAGGKVVKFEDNQTFTYNKESLLNGFFVVYGEMR